MTPDKAREYFSAYREGALEPGLAASLERKLQGEPALREEYESFAQTLDSLDALRFEEIEVPFYLNDRISSRIDGALGAKPAPFWAGWFAPRGGAPRFGYALGLAAALLVASIGLRGMQSSGTSDASIAPLNNEPVRWSKSDDGVLAAFQGGAARKVVVAPEGGEPKDYAVAAHQPFELTLANANPSARRFKVTQDDELVATVAVPGARPTTRRAGSGTVSELASALADAYRIPVVVKGLVPGTTVAWKFDSVDARTAAEASLDGQGSAMLMAGSVLVIGR